MPLSSPGAETPPTPPPSPRIVVPSTFYARQKERIANEILSLIEGNPTSPEEFHQIAEGTIYAVCEDRDEGLLIPLVDEYGARIKLRDLTISPRTIRNFLLQKPTNSAPSARNRTWQFLSAFLQARAFLPASARLD